MNEICPTCNGSGGIDVFEDSIGEIVTIPCPDCGGSGVSRMKEGGPGTRSFVYETLKKTLEGEE